MQIKLTASYGMILKKLQMNAKVPSFSLDQECQNKTTQGGGGRGDVLLIQPSASPSNFSSNSQLPSCAEVSLLKDQPT